MNVAVFSDVHGNLIALERFIEATRDQVDAYLCLGDVVNYGPWNDECLEIVRQLPGITLLEGNHERLFLGKEDIHHESALVQDFYDHSIRGFSHADLITGLPCCTRVGIFDCIHTIDGRSIYQDTPIEIGRNYIIGHTHHQFQIDRSGFMIVNPGSVGQNRRWIDMVDYLILDTVSGEIAIHSVPYDFDRFLSELLLRRYPEDCIRYYANKPRKVARDREPI
jgi:predicted phosphodiesterase